MVPGRERQRVILQQECIVSDSAARTKAESPSYTISLHIKHPTIDPAAITKELGLTPDHAWACGEPKRSSSASTSGIRRNSFWCAALAPPTMDPRFSAAPRESAKFQRAMEMVSTDVGSYLNVQLLRLRRHQAFIQGLLDEGGELSFVVEVPTGDVASFKLDPSVTRQIGTMGATLEFQFS
jgi:hypothetical protein